MKKRNPEIKVGNKTIFYKNYSDAGINCIRDLIKNDGNFFEYEEFIDIHNIITDCITYGGILHAIPQNWKINILEIDDIAQVQMRNYKFWPFRINKLEKPNRIIYRILLNTHTERPEKAELKWHQDLNINKDELSEFYILHKKVLSRDTLLRAFQYKISNRILATNRLLFKMNISPYELCTFCFTESESIQHLFWQCNISKNIWFQIFDELNIQEKFPSLEISEKTILFGHIGDEESNIFLNILIALIKQCIYNSKINLKDPVIQEVRRFVLTRSRIHKSIDINLDISILQPWGWVP